MAVNVDANLKTAALLSQRRPIWKVLFDWDNAGFGNQGSWTDESAYLVSAHGDMSCSNWQQSMSPLGPSGAGTCTVVLSNTKNRFSNADPNSTLYAKIGGTKIKFKRAVVKTGFYYGGASYWCPMITGYVVAMSETENSKKVQFSIQDRAADMQATRVNTDLYSGFANDYIESQLLTELSRDKMTWDGGYGSSYVDPGIFWVDHYWADGESIWDELNALALSQMGIVFWDRSGNFHFHDGSYFCKANSTSYLSPLTSQATFTNDDYVAVVPNFDARRSFSKIQVEYTPRYLGALQTVYNTPDIWMVAPGATETFECVFRNPSYVLTPVVNEDYTVITCGGIDIHSSVSLTFAFSATLCEVTATNNHATLAALICGMTFQGYPVLARQTAKYEATESSPVVENTWKPSANPYIQSVAQAQAIAEFALARYSSALHGVRIVGAKACPWLEVGDRITVTGGGLNASDPYYHITKIAWATGFPFLMDIEAVRASDLYPGSDYFCMGGGGGYSGHKYGSGTGHGHLFW